jgi:hypothetical protein
VGFRRTFESYRWSPKVIEAPEPYLEPANSSENDRTDAHPFPESAFRFRLLTFGTGQVVTKQQRNSSREQLSSSLDY